MRAEQFGRFLIQLFDEWLRHDVGRVYVQTFEAAVRNWLRMPSSGMCVFEATCGLGLALEHNGDLYSCDHFDEPDYLLGNIIDTPMIADQDPRELFLVLSPERAARLIARAIERGRHEYWFPWRTWLLARVAKALPTWLYHAVARKLPRRSPPKLPKE